MKTMRFATLAFAMALLALPGMSVARAAHTVRQTIAQYPVEVREAVCTVGGYPELPVALVNIQHQSRADFADLLDPYGRQDQEALWDLARFPGLIDRLADCDLQDDAQVSEVLAEYPAEIGVTALKYARQEHEVLIEIADLHRRTEAQFTAVLSAYSSQTQGRARLLLQYPELMSLMDTDPDQVALLGDAYREDPDLVRHQLAQLHLEYANSTRPDRPASRRAGGQQVSRPRSGRYDYDPNTLDGPSPTTQVKVVYHRSYYEYPYPYWFGYPRWYGPTSWYTGLNWRLTPHVSASIGIEVPVVREVVPVYRRVVPVVREVVPACPVVVPVYRKVVSHHRHGEEHEDWEHGRGHRKHRGKNH